LTILPPPPLAHDWDDGLRAKKCTGEIDRNDAVPFLEIEVDQRDLRDFGHHRRIVDEDVHAPKRIACSGDGGADGLTPGDIDLDAEQLPFCTVLTDAGGLAGGIAGEVRSNRSRASAVNVRDDDGRTSVSECTSVGGTDSLRVTCARYDRDLSCE
jgi:hypothetical protein